MRVFVVILLGQCVRASVGECTVHETESEAIEDGARLIREYCKGDGLCDIDAKAILANDGRYRSANRVWTIEVRESHLTLEMMP
jgi:hypothetical protein